MTHYRLRAALALAGVVALGVASRLVQLDVPLWGTQLGDSLYAAAFYLALSIALPGLHVGPKALAIGLFCAAVELFQLTGVPAALNQSTMPAVRLFAYAVLGSGFSWDDLLAYAVGVGLVALLDGWGLRRAGGE